MINKKLAIDFDGTIVDDAYPGVGPAKIFAFRTLLKLQSEGYRLILWTYRSGQALQDAVDFCKKNGLEFYAVNSSFEGEVFDSETHSRKIDADMFIDDRNLGGFLDGVKSITSLKKNRIPRIRRRSFSLLKVEERKEKGLFW